MRHDHESTDTVVMAGEFSPVANSLLEIADREIGIADRLDRSGNRRIVSEPRSDSIGKVIA